MRRLRSHKASRAASSRARKSRREGVRFRESTSNGIHNQGRMTLRNAPKRLL